MARIDGWEKRLADEVEAARHLPFVWGTHDCVLWAADCVKTITGIDYAKDYRARYKTKRGAYRILKNNPVPDRVGEIFEPITPALARRGDVVFKENSLGICFGAVSYFIHETGLCPIKTLTCEKAWRV